MALEALAGGGRHHALVAAREQRHAQGLFSA